jgi:hypothetical protein
MRVTLGEEHSMSLCAQEAADAEERVGTLQQAASRMWIGPPWRIVDLAVARPRQRDEIEQRAQLEVLHLVDELLRARSPRTGRSESAVSGTSSRRSRSASTRTECWPKPGSARAAGSSTSRTAAGSRSLAARKSASARYVRTGSLPRSMVHSRPPYRLRPRGPIRGNATGHLFAMEWCVQQAHGTYRQPAATSRFAERAATERDSDNKRA